MAKGSTKGQNSSKVKAAPSKSGSNSNPKTSSTSTSGHDPIPRDLQQKCLNLFRDTFQPGDDDKETLQAVKGHLFQREFAAAFSKEEYLRVYASRWSPSRALGYLRVFEDLKDFLQSETEADAEALRVPASKPKVVFFGGASAEIVAFAAWLKLNQSLSEEACRWKSGEAVLVDVADWKPVVEALQTSIITAPPLSKYASAAAKEANVPLLPEDSLSVAFLQHNVLDLDEPSVRSMTEGGDLVTLLFTLNELYATSIAKTQQFMSHLTTCCRPGTLLLVVDSPGSYSTVSINGTEKKYPMHWLLDHTLIGTGSRQAQRDPGSVKWDKLVTDESRWFRLPAGLEYPIELENMRYQVHLYRRIEGGVAET